MNSDPVDFSAPHPARAEPAGLAAQVFADGGVPAARILLAEDGTDQQAFICAILAGLGLELVVVADGQSAVQRVAAEDFHLVLMDMQMPGMDGFDAAGELRRLGFTKPIIALTANASADDRDRCIQCGCTDYLAKPVDGGTLLAMVAAYLKQPITAGTAGTVRTGPGVVPDRGPILSSLERDPLMAEILPAFIDALPTRVASMSSLLARAELKELRAIVHQIKGAGGSFGFDCLTALAAAAEANIDADRSLHEVKDGVDALVAVIRRIRGYGQSGESPAGCEPVLHR